MPVSINQQIEEVERELQLRRTVFPRLVAKRRYSQSEADYLMRRMEAVLDTLRWCRENRDACVAFIQQKESSNESDQKQDREPQQMAPNAQEGRDRV